MPLFQNTLKKTIKTGHISGSRSASTLLFHPTWALQPNLLTLQMLVAKIRL